MRFPYVININTQLAYEPSQDALELIREEDRLIFPEDLNWGDDQCPSLITFCVQAISKYFQKIPILNDLPGSERDHLLEIIPTDLPLELVIPLINDEIYWKRRYDDTYGIITRSLYSNWTWKGVFIERYIQQIIEEAQPQYNDEDGFGDITNLCYPYVYHFVITQLQAWKPPLTMEKHDIPEFYPIDHINIEPILKNLINIQELDLVFGMNNVAEIFKWDLFNLSVLDCQRLGNAIQYLNDIKIIRVHRSKLEDSHCQALMHGLITNKTLVELDLSNCHIADRGALCVAKLMLTHPTLQYIILSNNKIGSAGGQGFGFALLEDHCCPIIRLDLKLNPLGHEGVMGILRALVRGTNLRELNVSSCYFDEDTPTRLAQMVKLNTSLEVLDVSNNFFGEEAGELLAKNLATNLNIKWLDIRGTDIPVHQTAAIKRLLLKNRGKFNDDEEQVEKVVDIDEEEEEIVNAQETDENVIEEVKAASAEK